jgi:FkbM family methyltransferase
MLRREFHGDGVTAIDCGANIGVHTLEWATAMTGWGSVVAIEAQERIYYALAGNIALNNCFNAIAIHGAVAAEPGVMKIPCPDYLAPASFGSLALKQDPDNAFIGQAIAYDEDKMAPVQKVPLDALNLSRVDLVKLDVPGMEMEALEGARGMIEAHHPILLIEQTGSRGELLRAFLAVHGYEVVEAGADLLGIHTGDPVRSHLRPHAAGQAASAA